jgi:hypothetical protein
MGWRERWVWPMGWGCGLPEPLRMCSGLPGHIPYAPPYVEPPLGYVAGFPDC